MKYYKSFVNDKTNMTKELNLLDAMTKFLKQTATHYYYLSLPYTDSIVTSCHDIVWKQQSLSANENYDQHTL